MNHKTLIVFHRQLNAHRKHIPEKLLTRKFLKLWLAAFRDVYAPRTPAEALYWSGIQYIMEAEGLMEREPERPSERAMRLSAQVVRCPDCGKLVSNRMPIHNCTPK